MDVNPREKWTKIHGSLLKDILNFYSIDRCTLLKQTSATKATKATKNSLGHWLMGDRFPPPGDRNYICEVLRKHIPGKKDSPVNKQMADRIKKKYIDLYNDFVGNNDPDIEMSEYISALLGICYVNGEPLSTPTGINDTLDPRPVAPVPYSDDLTEVSDTNELTSRGFDSLTAGKKNNTVNPAGSATLTSIDTFEACLSAQQENTAVAPIKLNVDDLGGDALIDGSLGAVLLANPTKCVNLDLSGSTFTSIGDRVFSGCKSLTSITIPKSVTSIGEEAFDGCTSLTSITVDVSNSNYSSVDGILYNKAKTDIIIIPKKITENVSIPNGVTTIGNFAFTSRTSLTGVTIPNTVTSIEKNAFDGCTSLTNITVDISNSNYSSVDGILYNKAKTDIIIIPKKITGNVSIPNGITTIGNSAFIDRTSLTDVTIPNSVIRIEEEAFWGCISLISVTIPNSVKSIGEEAFWGCTSLTKVTIENGVINIRDYAFEHCTSLPSITIPNSVESIGWGAFKGCTNLKSVIIENSATNIGEHAFSGCTNLKSVIIENSVTNIGEYAFSGCTALPA